MFICISHKKNLREYFGKIKTNPTKPLKNVVKKKKQDTYCVNF